MIMWILVFLAVTAILAAIDTKGNGFGFVRQWIGLSLFIGGIVGIVVGLYESFA